MQSQPDNCFICLQENNLKCAEICCGKTFYHNKCLEQYCENYNDVPLCPI